MELERLTIHETRDLLVKKDISAYELTEASIRQIQRTDGKIGAFLTTSFDEALEGAKEVDGCLSRGEKLPDLAGIPVGIKDNICVEGLPATCASRMLENFIPPYDATVIRKLKGKKAILMGKLNMDEFAMGPSTETSAFHITRNPWDLTRVPGGSSGGSSASVASNQVYYALGSDTGGSVRQPAAFCGMVGLKPTYGLVSRFGLIAYASSFEQIGPITKDVTDSALVLNAIAGYDPADPTSADRGYRDYERALVDDVKRMKIGIPKEAFREGLNEEVHKIIERSIKTFEELGAQLIELSLPHMDYALPVYYIIACAEASSNLARYDGIRYGYRAEGYNNLEELYERTRSIGFGSEVKRRILLGNYTLSSECYDAYYVKAMKVRTLMCQDYRKAFEKCDVILTPTSPTTAFRIGEKPDNLMEVYLSDIYTIPANIAGLPALSIPCGFDSSCLPVGMQLIGNYFGESTLLQAAYTFEQNTDYHLPQSPIDNAL